MNIITNEKIPVERFKKDQLVAEHGTDRKKTMHVRLVENDDGTISPYFTVVNYNGSNVAGTFLLDTAIKVYDAAKETDNVPIQEEA